MMTMTMTTLIDKKTVSHFITYYIHDNTCSTCFVYLIQSRWK